MFIIEYKMFTWHVESNAQIPVVKGVQSLRAMHCGQVSTQSAATENVLVTSFYGVNTFIEQ